MSWLACHNPEINWRTEEVKMMRCSEECEKQWRLRQEKVGQQKQKEEEKKEEIGKKQEEREKRQKKEKKKPKKERNIEVRKVAEEWEIWDEKEEAKKLVPAKFHKQIYVFSKKTSEWMPTRKLWDYTIYMKKGFIPRKRKVYLLSREEQKEVCEFIVEQLRKEYIRLLKLPQMALVFFIGKKDRKKWMVQDYKYLNEWMVKNNYPLPFISDIIENIGIKKYLQRWT